ncbi:MAG: murein L,D-transpeptidase catalytic domain-containing protein [Chitinophagaceae bacterium]
MKRVFIIAVIGVLVFTAGSAAWYAGRLRTVRQGGLQAAVRSVGQTADKKLSTMATAARQYATQNNFNTRFCFLVDMSIASGEPRFFVFDLKADSIVRRGLVTHGRCNEQWLADRKYANTIGCGCTSLGRYRIGNPYSGKFGRAYKLAGMDVTNSNAYARFVVLHAHSCVPEQPVAPDPICQSDGCPTVAPGFLKELSALLDKSSKPVLLWIYQ